MRTRLTALLFLCCVHLFAQDTPRAVVFGGYSYLNAEITQGIDRQGVNGWEAAFSVNANRWLAGEGDFSGYYKNLSADLGGLGTVSARITDYSFFGGPRINFRPVFVHALIGADHLTGSSSGISLSQDSLAIAAGGGIEWPISHHLGVRASGDYIFTRHNILVTSGQTQNNFRASVGIVYFFGGQGAAKTTSAAPLRDAIEISALGVQARLAPGGGAAIVGVDLQSPANMAGLTPGDIIDSIDGTVVRSPQEAAAALAGHGPGNVRIGFMAHGMAQAEVTVTLR